MTMTNILVRHKVRDYASWKVEFDHFVDFRKSSGEKSYRILHPGDDPNDLLLLFEWDSPKNAEKFFASPQLKSTMQRAGVSEEPRVQFLDEVARGQL
jgi:quinol monooxygenase YgiN